MQTNWKTKKFDGRRQLSIQIESLNCAQSKSISSTNSGLFQIYFEPIRRFQIAAFGWAACDSQVAVDKLANWYFRELRQIDECK